LGVAAVAGVFAACSTFGSDTSSAPPPPPSNVDAAAPADAAPPPAAPPDGAAPEADGAAPDPGTCPTLAFCDDFERPTGPSSVQGSWNAVFPRNPTGLLEIVDSPVAAGARSLRAQVTTNANGNAYLEHTISVVVERATVSFFFRTDAEPAVTAPIATIEMRSGGALALGLGTKGVVQLLELGGVVDGGQQSTIHEVASIAQNSWYKLTLAYDGKVSPASAAVKVEGPTPPASSSTIPTDPKYGFGKPSSIRIGVPVPTPKSPAFYFDNVLIREGVGSL
jgi:hypothetical protein